ncbi:hypothetical protein BH09PAT2_BH09PAT2_05570 [soil metagenome]
MSYIQKTKQYAQNSILPYSILLFFCLSILQIFFIFFIIRNFALSNIENEINTIAQRVSKGLTYSNGAWDTSRYTSDPETPHPSGSSGFSTPLYIVGTDGFVIERNAPITGLLDSSDFNHLMQYQTIQTVSVITNEQWRILSTPIVRNGKTIGIIVGALYRPERFVPTISDTKLNSSLKYLANNIRISDEVIDVSNIDIRGVDYDISFEIVTNYNKVLLNNGRMPTFIDKSYVYDELKKDKKVRVINDPLKKISYMVVSKTLYDTENNPVGIVLAGQSISFLNTIFNKAIPFLIGSIIVFTIIALFCLRKLITEAIQRIISFYDQEKKVKPLPSSITFNKHEGKLSIDDHVIEIPLDSNQYYFCRVIFTNTKKHWEFDEILEAFGDDTNSENWRKVYDTMTILNKKISNYLPVKLIELREKTYFINPELQPLIKAL